MGADTFFGFHLFSNPKIQVAQLVPTASCNWVFPLLSVVVHQTGRLTALQPERQEKDTNCCNVGPYKVQEWVDTFFAFSQIQKSKLRNLFPLLLATGSSHYFPWLCIKQVDSQHCNQKGKKTRMLQYQQGDRTPTVAMWVRTKFKNGC